MLLLQQSSLEQLLPEALDLSLVLFRFASEVGDLLLQLRNPAFTAGELVEESVDLMVCASLVLLLFAPELFDGFLKRVPLGA
jgi:hypothetical protein